MSIREQLVEYRDGETLLEGMLCYDAARPGPLPAVMINHAWGGRDEFVERKARRLAWQGYAAFALDMYGKGVRGANPEQNAALMQPFMTDRSKLLQRMQAALTALRLQPQADAKRIAAMGFCFGGLCVLDLARSGAEVRGVISFHGMLKSNGLPRSKQIPAKILMLHGYDDPLAPPQDMLAVTKEFSELGADWQLHAYGHTLHSFTNPQANHAAGGMMYNAAADRRSWHALLQFLEEVLR